MKKILLALLLIPNLVYASPSNTLSILPVATDGTTITASDENDRNNTISTAYNAHSHTDISQVGNTLSVGDATAGNKTIAANTADVSKPFVRFDDTADDWIFSVDGTISSMSLSGSGVTFEGDTNDAFETTVSVINPTADRTITFPNSSGTVALGFALPSGAVFFMASGSCPSGTTDISSTYSNKYIKINSTQLTSSGVVLTGTSDSHTLTVPEMPAHTHDYSAANTAPSSGASSGGDGDETRITGTTASTGGGGGHAHTLSSATTLEPSSVTMKLCQVL